MAAGVRYRYKGKFISHAKAQKISNLKSASKFITTEYTGRDKKADTIRRGYKEPIERAIKKAIERKEIAPVLSPDDKKIIRRQKERDVRERHIARQIAEIAEGEDISIEEAMDSFADDIEGWFLDTDRIKRFSEAILEEGEIVLEFELTDLEGEEKRWS